VEIALHINHLRQLTLFALSPLAHRVRGGERASVECRKTAMKGQSSGGTEWPVMAPWQPFGALENWMDDCHVS
jgi:hypothetical protein